VPDGVLPASGEFVNVEITAAHEYDLIGKIAADFRG
jgi:tRNA A37 methylthiotransferase MiaB